MGQLPLSLSHAVELGQISRIELLGMTEKHAAREVIE
jgi:hypothetical protein